MEHLTPNAEKIQTAFDAVSAAAGSQTAGAASDVAFDPFLVGLHAIREFVSNVTTSTRNAISAYDAGDLEMAADFEREATGIE